MSKLTTQEKHDLLTEFQQQRADANEVYQSAKAERKAGQTAEEAREYQKLYKKLGQNH